ncbi:ATP-dependent Clp protease ATP-binding subunit [Pediococcus inopinatus]|uniref:ATP-dependent Clp protease ATP-binding subunit n=1 Tax=Pediococcus inopinatus TaxID=114090 RepID=A0ABZ0Q2B3_9LACO|nr:ATP-dependent Clp protease ATP-binding subunit [Pediococcus inopinatus]WPC19294.1 ATP-dependent Clp protease ATP-binding subunit [Pediococcus inopinatus]WPC21084.1 ATP-dependent Clp protease ATP-binding subunit [Pediococcus inopinatus]
MMTMETSEQIQTPLLDQYTTDLTDKVMMAPDEYQAIGRGQQIRDLIHSLTRKTKNSPLLIGEAGVGKTATVEGLAKEIWLNNVPDRLLNHHILVLEMASIHSDSSGTFSEKFNGLIQELKKTKGRNIMFIDEIHEIVNTGASSNGSALDAGNILKPALARGEISIIGCTTIDEFHKYLEQDRALQRRFQVIELPEPTTDEAIQIISGIKRNYEKFHGVKYTDRAIKETVLLSKRYITDRFLPDKAIDLLDEAGSIAENKSDKTIRAREIAEVLKDWTGIPVTTILKDEATRLLNIEKKLSDRVKGQSQAVHEVADAVSIASAGLQDVSKPIASFLFLGTTGVGKTEMAKALTEAMFDREDNYIRLDMSEFSGKDGVEKLIGKGDHKGVLTEAVKHQPYAVVLFDELEKARPEVWNLLLQILDDGRLTTGDNTKRLIDFKNTIIIMTTNVGSEFIKDIKDFKGTEEAKNKDRQFQKNVNAELITAFHRPEFINRIDHIIVFNVLDKPVIRVIARKRLAELRQKLNNQGYELHYQDEDKQDSKLIDYLADIGTDVDNGARPLARAIYNVITAPIAHIVLRFDRSNPRNFHTFFIDIKGKSADEIENSLIDERKVIFHARP